MYTRLVTKQIAEILPHFSSVLIRGCRYAGKTTIAQHLLSEELVNEYITLDDLKIQEILHNDAYGYLSSLPPLTVIDEVQKVPEIFIILKQIIDERRNTGNHSCQFILTGSANIFLLPKLSESLAGRMAIFNIRPLSQSEVIGTEANFLDKIFEKELDISALKAENLESIVNKIHVGGYAYALSKPQPKIRNIFFKNYLESLLERDIRDISNIEGLTKIPTILQILASNIGNVNNYANLARLTNIKEPTLKNYINILRAIYVVEDLKPYFTNKIKRLVKSPKFYLNDTGLLCHINGYTPSYLLENKAILGGVLENFVYNELCKLADTSETDYKIHYLRTSSGVEIDFIIEHPNGKLCLIEVKSASSINRATLSNFRLMKESLQEQLHRNIILYTGSPQNISLDSHALPINSFWSN